MSGHSADCDAHQFVVDFDRDTLTVRVVCNAEPGATCRLEPVGNDCDCESWHVERDEVGPYHLYLTEDDDGKEVEVRHDMRDSGDGQFGPHCNVREFMNEDAQAYLEEGRGRPSFEVGRFGFKPIWTGDYYEWEATQTTVTAPGSSDQ